MSRVRMIGVSLFTAFAGVSGTVTHPVENVISLLKRLDEKIQEEARTEALTYQKFEYWCATSSKSLNKAIAGEKSDLDALADEIESYEKNIEVLDDTIASLDSELQEFQKVATEASAIRTTANNLYMVEKSALQGTITAIGQALDAMNAAKTTVGLVQAQKRVRAVLALLSIESSSEVREGLEEFVAPERPDLKAAGDYGSHVKKYSFKGDSVIELLKGLKLKFEDELNVKNNVETDAVNAYDLAKGARDNLIAAATLSRGSKDTSRTQAKADLATAEATQTSTQSDLDADSTTLSDTVKSCRVKKSEWDERTETRNGESKAIHAAIAILAKATGVRTEAPENPTMPVSPVSPVSFIQVSEPDKRRAVQILRQEAVALHSKALEQLAEQVEATPGRFDQVVNMIQKMIFRLMNEQKDEDNHKNWCDLEVNKTNVSIADKAEKIKKLNVDLQVIVTEVAALARDINTANDMVATITAHMTEATEIREIGKKENAEAVRDAQDAQSALTGAIAVLKDFYKETGAVAKESWEFLQRARVPVELPNSPNSWDTPYTAVSSPEDQPDGILSVLEKVSADFALMESNTAAQEQTDSNLYKEDMKSCEIEKARRMKQSEMKTQETKRLEDKKQAMLVTRKGVQGEKEATEQYLQDLQPACVEGSSTYEDRKAARTQEVDALQEAQGVLQNAFNSTNISTNASNISLVQVRLRR